MSKNTYHLKNKKIKPEHFRLRSTKLFVTRHHHKALIVQRFHSAVWFLQRFLLLLFALFLFLLHGVE